MNAQIKIGSIAQIARSVEDIKKAEHWYRTINAPHVIHKHGDGTEEWLGLMAQARP